MLKGSFVRGLIFCFIGLAMGACSNSTQENREVNPHLRGLITQADELQDHINQRRMFAESTQRDRTSLQRLIHEIKVGLMHLYSGRDPVSSVRSLYRSVKALEIYPISLRDRARLDEFLQNVNLAMNQAALAYGVPLHDVSWSLFFCNFSEGLRPFSSFASGGNWTTGWAQRERSYTSVTGAGNRSWLLSPAFDLRFIENPSFKIRHTLIINRNTRGGDLDRLAISYGAVQAKVLIGYEEGDPDLLPPENIHSVELGPRPNSYDFHTVDSLEVDLSAYREENVTVALLFDNNDLGGHYVTWQIYEFNLFGRGQLPTVRELPSVLYEHNFNSQTLDPYLTFDFLPDGAKWEPFGFNNRFRYAKIEPNGQPTEAWLIAQRPFAVDGQKNLSLLIKETVRTPEWDNFKILVSTDYSSGDDPRQAQWQELKREGYRDIEDGDWKDFVFGPFDLNFLQGQDFTLAFQYLNDGRRGPSWEIETIQILGVGEDIMYRGWGDDFAW